MRFAYFAMVQQRELPRISEICHAAKKKGGIASYILPNCHALQSS